ncbi:uncharacterized protein LOC144107980 [Amblyomma americanum]
MAVEKRCCVLPSSDEEDETEVKPVIVGVTQRHPKASRLLRPCSMEGSDIEATLSRRLHEAVRAGDAAGVAASLSSGIVLADDPNKDCGGCTAILEATRHDQPAVASVLLDFGCDPCLGDNRGWTALHEVFRSPAVAKLLFERAALSWKGVADSVYGLTPLHACVKAAVASHTAPTEEQLEVIREVASRCKGDARNLYGDTCLHLAASGRHDRPEVVRVLLDAAHIRNAQNDRGETALHVALTKGHYKTAALLIELPLADKSRKQSIADSVAGSSQSSVRTSGANHHVTSNGGASADDSGVDETQSLSEAENGDEASDKQVSAPPETPQVAEVLAVFADKNTQTVDLLDPSLCDRFGQTVLHYCASQNVVQLLESLLQNYGVRDVQDLRGETALHVAARRGHDKCVELLLDFGADAGIRNDEGMTPLDLAVAAGFAGAAKILCKNATEPLLRNADAVRRNDSVRRCTVIGKMFLEHSAQMKESGLG